MALTERQVMELRQILAVINHSICKSFCILISMNEDAEHG